MFTSFRQVELLLEQVGNKSEKGNKAAEYRADYVEIGNREGWHLESFV